MIWSAAAVALASRRERRAVPVLLDRINATSLRKKSGLLALAEIGGPGVLEGVEPICKNLELFSPVLCWGVKAKLGDEESWQKLLVCARNVKSRKDRIAAAKWLTYAGQKRAIHPLLKLLTDKNGDVRQVAANAMGVIADLPPLAREALRKALDDPEAPVRSAAAKALRNWRIRRTGIATNSAWSAPAMLRQFTSRVQQPSEGTPR